MHLAVLGQSLDSTTLKVFSNLKDSLIVSFFNMPFLYKDRTSSLLILLIEAQATRPSAFQQRFGSKATYIFQIVNLSRAMHLDNIYREEKLYIEANDAFSGLSKSEGFVHSIEEKRNQTL